MVPKVSEPPVVMSPPTIEVEKSPPLKPVSDASDPLLPTDATMSRPETVRRATAPESPPTQKDLPTLTTISLPLRPRTRSPFTRGHGRSRSSNGSCPAPQMTRAHSSPVSSTPNRPLVHRPSSPLGPPSRHRSPMRKPSEEPFSIFSGGLDIAQTISENSELDLTPKVTTGYDSMPSSPIPYSHQTFPRSRRRPASPLLHQSSQPSLATSTPRNTLRACISTPSLAASQYNESYPSNFSSSSMPSTPTSLRSRSPSISSLETIPDSPDAEEEAEKIAKLKAAADREDQGEEEVRRRVIIEVGGRGGNRDKRKRWSVCGAERRGDLSLETIWEG